MRSDSYFLFKDEVKLVSTVAGDGCHSFSDQAKLRAGSTNHAASADLSCVMGKRAPYTIIVR